MFRELLQMASFAFCVGTRVGNRRLAIHFQFKSWFWILVAFVVGFEIKVLSPVWLLLCLSLIGDGCVFYLVLATLLA